MFFYVFIYLKSKKLCESMLRISRNPSVKNWNFPKYQKHSVRSQGSFVNWAKKNLPIQKWNVCVCHFFRKSQILSELSSRFQGILQSKTEISPNIRNISSNQKGVKLTEMTEIFPFSNGMFMKLIFPSNHWNFGNLRSKFPKILHPKMEISPNIRNVSSNHKCVLSTEMKEIFRFREGMFM